MVMRDLHLWRLLQHPTQDPAEVVPLLRTLAGWPLPERVAYLGLLPPLLRHADPAVRAAALDALGGCTGRSGLQRITQGLNDPDPAVRRCAVEALRRSSCSGDRLRWVHALFHPDPDVRRAALDPQRDFPLPPFCKVFLLPDPACRALVEEQLARDQLDGEALPLLFDYLRQGLVPPAIARRLVRGVSWNDWLVFLGDLLPRTRDMSATLAEAMKPDWPVNLFGHYHPDRLDEVLLLMWDPDVPDEVDSPHRAFFALLGEAALAEGPFFQQWLTFTLLGVAVQKGSWPPAAAALCAALYPDFLNCPWVPQEVRQALGGFEPGPRGPAEPPRPAVQPEAIGAPGMADLADFSGADVQTLAAGVLMAGLGEPLEQQLLAHLEHCPPGSPGREDALAGLLSAATSPEVRQQARRALRGVGRSHKLRRVADTFAWGVRIGRQLTGKLFSLEMIAGEDLGYTRLRENKLYISPLPLLRGQHNGREVVRALILHEYGHHLYHKGEEAEGVWEQAHDEELPRLLNLVADEHLERNLRARDGTFGDQLKMLAAHAFQHTAREIPVETLLGTLRGQAFAVLSSTHLGVARRPGCVIVSSGKVLLQMERAGLSFARFLRALRMGLGNRHADPKVAQALELFRGPSFRASTMPQLLEIARRLRDLFGDETDLLNTFNQDAALLGDADDLTDAGEGLTDEELQAEVRRVLESGGSAPRRSSDGGRTRNVDPGEDFEPISNVVRRLHDPVRHAEYARQVLRQAERMRRFLHRLGLGLMPQRLRVRGRSVDRTRTRAVVLRGDPRMLTARETQRKTDLFLGVLIDCSGSMSSDGNLEKAKLFGTLLALAARNNPAIDLRLWGFTDRTIYDCGNASRPAVHDLTAEDGNNDAAALWHAALAARASRRRARLLVMISDGSPTGCSVQALTALVQRLTRRMKILCAQVAVRPLDDECFGHHVLLEEGPIDESVGRFGTVVLDLVHRALGG